MRCHANMTRADRRQNQRGTVPLPAVGTAHLPRSLLTTLPQRLVRRATSRCHVHVKQTGERETGHRSWNNSQGLGCKEGRGWCSVLTAEQHAAFTLPPTMPFDSDK